MHRMGSTLVDSQIGESAIVALVWPVLDRAIRNRRAVALTCTEPRHQATHWTGRAMAKAIRISLGSV